MKIINGRIGGPVHIFCLFFILCVFCVSAAHFMRSESHNLFRFNPYGGTIREGVVGGGCEPKDIISLGDRLASDPVISGMDQNKQISEAINKSTEAAKNLWGGFQMFVTMARAAATMRSKPDEQHIRKIMADGATKKEIDCEMFKMLPKEIEAVAGLSAEQKNTIKKYTNEFLIMGQCLGWCK